MDIGSWSVAAPAIGSAFVASLVEVVEAFTIILAVGTLRGWRPAVIGTFVALVVLGFLVLLLGPLIDLVPLHVLQLVIGVLLLVFGLGWLRKAILRAAGIIPLHDEEAIFASETTRLAEVARHDTSRDWIAGLTAFKAVLLEGLEVVFIVPSAPDADSCGRLRSEPLPPARLLCASVPSSIVRSPEFPRTRSSLESG